MSDFFTNKHTENIQNEKDRHTLYNIIVLITIRTVYLIRCVLSDDNSDDIYLIHYNLKQRQMRFKSVRYRSAYSVIQQKKTPPNFTVRWCQRFLEKIKYYFRRNMVFGNMKCCYLILNKKHSPIFTDTCVLKKLQNLTKRYFSLTNMSYSFIRSFNSFNSSA